MADPAQLSLTEAAAAVRSGRLRAGEPSGACRRRIETLDGALAAWAAVNDGQAPTRGDGPLAGVPVGIKDVIDAAGLPTRAGSTLHEAFPTEDAPAVAWLRRAGATILGKTVCTEFATNDPAPTRNPWDAARTPGGSSSGSAAAVAACMCHATLDTQTAGDILRPAAYNGVVGFKPGLGRISREGTVGVAWSIDTLGVQARHVGDVTALYEVLCKEDEGTGRPVEPDHPPVIGVVRDPLLEHCDAETDAEVRRVTAELTRAGAVLREARPPVSLEVAVAAHRIVTFAECASLHDELYRRAAADLGPKFRTLLELGLVTPAASYLRAQRVRGRLRTGLEAMLREVQILLLPVVPTAAPRDRDTTGDPAFQIPWTFAGLPALALPTGLGTGGMPLAVQLVGPRQGERDLLGAARWCEAVLDADLRPPLD